jgi:ribonuclease HII
MEVEWVVLQQKVQIPEMPEDQVAEQEIKEVAQEELELLIKVLLEDLLQEVVLVDKLEAAEEPVKQEIQMVKQRVEMDYLLQ